MNIQLSDTGDTLEDWLEYLRTQVLPHVRAQQTLRTEFYETVNSNRYSQQLICLNQEIEWNRPFIGKGKRSVKLLYDNGLMLVNL